MMKRVFLMMILSLASASALYAGDDDEIMVGRWDKAKSGPKVIIPLVDRLTAKQKQLVNSGFSTFSQLSVSIASESDKNASAEPFYQVSCTVKLDTWEERYDVARLDPQPSTMVVKKFDEYARLCLAAEIDEHEKISRFSASGAMLDAILILDQISPEQANNLRQWIIRQQSGIMQKLFSHMLGEMTLTEKINVKVRLPRFGGKIGAVSNSKEVRVGS